MVGVKNYIWLVKASDKTGSENVVLTETAYPLLTTLKYMRTPT